MSDTPWLTIIGLGEDGPAGLTGASLQALKDAEIVTGPPRHLALLGKVSAQVREWPIPFSDGLDQLEALRGQKVVALVSGDPFWFGAGSVFARRFARSEWRALPGLSVFSLAAAHLGWPLETTTCLGLHAASYAQLRPHLAAHVRLIVTLRDGMSPGALGQYLSEFGFGDTTVHVMQALGGPSQAVSSSIASQLSGQDFATPVCAALEIAGHGQPIALSAGRDDSIFATDGQITKRPVRALTLSALAPRPFERLWDIGGGSGSIAIEWLLSHPSTQATCIEIRPDRAARITQNAETLGVERLSVVVGAAPEVIAGLPLPQAVFIGGGLSDALMEALQGTLPAGTRLVANAVTLESEAMLTKWQGVLGGDLLRIDLSHAKPLGPRLGWQASYPVVQWSVTL
jgi:precorrin-6Y C5,15-methyltransferase (decarboxylating)